MQEVVDITYGRTGYEVLSKKIPFFPAVDFEGFLQLRSSYSISYRGDDTKMSYLECCYTGV